MPSLAYRNLFETGSVGVSTEDADFPRQNAYDWLAYPGDVWKPIISGTSFISVDAGVAVSADFFAIHGHDIDSIKLQYSNDNFAADVNDVVIPGQNLLQYSEEIDNAIWAKTAVTIDADIIISPGGLRTADKVVSDTSTGAHRVNHTTLTVTAGTYTVSAYVKQGGYDFVYLLAFSALDGFFISTGFDLSDGTVSAGTGTIKDVGGGWFLISASGVLTDTTMQVLYEMRETVSSSFTGDGSSGFYLWGAQLTKSAAALPYIKTTSAAAPAIAPNGSEVIYREFDSLSSRYWRFEVINTTNPSSLAVICLGEKLTIPESVQIGFSPANLARKNTYLNSVSDAGQFLGRRLISNGADMPLSFDLLSPAFVRGQWDTFIQHAEAKPFFFAWDYTNYPTEAAYCWTSNKIPKPVYSQPNFMQVMLNVNAST